MERWEVQSKIWTLTPEQKEDYKANLEAYRRMGFHPDDARECALAGVLGDFATTNRLRAAYQNHARNR